MKWIDKNVVPQLIEWNKPNWVRLIGVPDFLVLTTGKNVGGNFSGMCMPCKDRPLGHYSDAWSKEKFELLPGTVMFPISNED